MDRIELIDGTTIKCQALTKEKFDSLLMTNGTSYLKEYMERYSIDVHLFENGEILIHDSGYYTLYFSLSDLDKVLNQENTTAGTEALLNKNIYGREFPAHAADLSKKLSDFFSVRYDGNQGNFLQVLDEKIDSLPDAQDFKSEHFLEILAVIGEALIQKYAAKWEMELGSDGVTWNPYLEVKGKYVQYFVYLYEDIFQQENHKRTLSEIYHTMISIINNNMLRT